ncbi:MAG TPA: acylphosphatase [Burkholderiales bacterium]|nr:acylphosphatase [Burkholderiales bacterium]
MNITRHLKIYGRVQGVAFRESMRIRAEQLRVTGWVRNRLDGSVEAMVQGSPQAVEAMIEWARRGPPAARVTKVDVEDGSGEFFSFEVARTP